MSEAHNDMKPPLVALLCLGDISVAEGAIPLMPIYGQPLLHHIIKQLETLGIHRFFIGLETVPGALLAYRDTLAATGMQIDFVRDPADMVDLGEAGILLLRADIVWDPASLAQALAVNGPIIATVEERSENAGFERIDLNHRWAGLAILEPKTVQSIAQLPDGWDMASALMRQGLQDGVSFWPVRQADLNAGAILPLASSDDVAKARTRLTPVASPGPKNLENAVLARPASALAALVWNVSWGRNVAYWLFPALAILTLLLGLARFALPSAIIGLLAICAAQVRKSVRAVEYLTHQQDREAATGWAAMSAALCVLLITIEPDLYDAIFTGLLLTGFMLAGAKVLNRIVVASPLPVALALIIGIATDTICV